MSDSAIESVSPYWARFVRRLRNREGLSQNDLAAMMGVTQASVSRWERGVDEPSLRLRRRMRDLFRTSRADRADRIVRLRVQYAAWPVSLVRPGAVFVAASPSLPAEIGAASVAIGRSIYGQFGPAADEVTEAWERTGIFSGDIAMTLSLNRIATPHGPAYIRGLDTPHFTDGGEIWCLCEIKRIGEDEYEATRSRIGGLLMALPFDSMA
jgi:transcriptional regulator with XRE-family HTH domain